MARGPLPQRTRRRRNEPTIPTSDLPAGGRKGPTPAVPGGVKLGIKGRTWWTWAWKTPQAAGWSVGDHVVLARRARLEDDFDALESIELELFHGDFDDIREVRRYARQLELVVGVLAKLAGGSLAIAREMRELDKALGLTPKALADLRWKIVPEQPAIDESAGDVADEVAEKREARAARLAAKA